MCSRACSSCATSGIGPSIIDHHVGGSTTCGCSGGGAGPGSVTGCLRTLLASTYNSSLCECSVECPLGTSRPSKRIHRLAYAPRYRGVNWWKSGANQGEAECIATVAEERDEKKIVDNIENRREVIHRQLPAGDILRRVEALLASLPNE